MDTDVHTHVCTHFRSHVGTHVSRHVRAHVRAHVHMSAHMSVYTSAHMSVHMSAHRSAHMSAHMSAHTVHAHAPRCRLTACQDDLRPRAVRVDFTPEQAFFLKKQSAHARAGVRSRERVGTCVGMRKDRRMDMWAQRFQEKTHGSAPKLLGAITTSGHSRV